MKKLTKEQIEFYRDKLITSEHGKFYKKVGQWDCECFPNKKVIELYNLFTKEIIKHL